MRFRGKVPTMNSLMMLRRRKSLSAGRIPVFAALILFTILVIITHGDASATTSTQSKNHRRRSPSQDEGHDVMSKAEALDRLCSINLESTDHGDDGDLSSITVGDVKAAKKADTEGGRCREPLYTNVCKDYYEHEKCQCQDPTIGDAIHNGPGRPHLGDRYEKTFRQQLETVANLTHSVDVIFLGDSITEHWLGTDLGEPKEKWQGILETFKTLFTKDGGSPIDGLVLGIAAGATWNVMYQLQNHALGPDTKAEAEKSNSVYLDPTVFWLNIGTNDVGGYCCDVDNMVAGNIAIVEALKVLRPNATIVINSLLPRIGGYWEILKAVNEKLACYAEIINGVEYFDATDIFKNETGFVNLFDGLHPDEHGHQLWGEAILKRVLEIVS